MKRELFDTASRPSGPVRPLFFLLHFFLVYFFAQQVSENINEKKINKILKIKNNENLPIFDDDFHFLFTKVNTAETAILDKLTEIFMIEEVSGLASPTWQLQGQFPGSKY